MQWMRQAWTAALGDLSDWPVQERDDRLLMLLGLAFCVAYFLTEQYPTRGGPLAHRAWRMLMFGGVPLLAVTTWTALAKGGSRIGTGLVALLLLIPIAGRLTVGNSVLQSQPLFALSGVLAMLLSYGLIARSRSSLAAWGLGIGDWRFWVPRASIFAVIVLIGVSLAMTLNPEMASYYPSYKPARTDTTKLMIQQLAIFVDFIGWEMLFRGVLLFGVARRGDIAVALWLQAIPFFLLHGHKPELELILSLPGGLIAGWFCLRARSFLPLLLLHTLQLGTINLLGFYLRQ